MLDVLLADLDPLPVDVLPVGTTYAPDYLLPSHAHRRAQLLYGAGGVMRVRTAEGEWTVPTNRAVLIPPGVAHEVLMLDVTTWSLYIEPGAVPWWPTVCTVVEVDALLRELLRAANALQLDDLYPEQLASRAASLTKLILHELQLVSPLPFTVPIPRQEPYRSLCHRYLESPDVRMTNSDWAQKAAVSLRTFDREFRRLTGMSPANWRAKARLLASLPMLKTNSVTGVSAQLGYSSPAAFSAAFSSAFGAPPSRFA